MDVYTELRELDYSKYCLAIERSEAAILHCCLHDHRQAELIEEAIVNLVLELLKEFKC